MRTRPFSSGLPLQYPYLSAVCRKRWSSSTVHLSTWGIGYRVSALDIALARTLDARYEEMRTRPTG
jgi:hypothetical protein